MEVKMKGLLAGFVVFVVIGCATVDKVGEYGNLDLAVEQSCKNIQNDFNETASVAVFNIVSSSTRLSEYIIEEVMNNFTNMHKYNVVERSKISAVFQEQNFQFSGNVSDDTIQRLGNMLGAQFVVTGSLDDAGSYYRLRLFVIAIESGERKSSTAVNIKKPNEQIVYLSDNSLIVSPDHNTVESEKIVKGEYGAVVAEIERLLSDVSSPQIWVWANDVDDNDANGDDGVVFTTSIPEDIFDYAPNYKFRMVKRSGRWMFENNNPEYTYESLIENVIEGLDGILILHNGGESYIYLWQ
jgi:TolB-like protein